MIKCEHMEEPNRRDLYYYYPNGDEAGYLCDECATETGFCPGCGAFVAGIDAEIPSIHEYGMCSQCVEELLTDIGMYDEDVDYPEGDMPPPGTGIGRIEDTGWDGNK